MWSQKRTKIGIHEFLSLQATEFVLMAGFFFLLTWISFSAISLDSLDKMLKTQPNSTCE